MLNEQTLMSEMQRSDEGIVVCSVQHIKSNVRRLVESMKEIHLGAERRQLDVKRAGPILNNMVVTLDLLQREASAFLQLFETNIGGRECKIESKESIEAKDIHSSYTQTVQSQSDITYKDLAKRLNIIEQSVLAKNLLKRLDRVEQNQRKGNTENENISKRLEAIEKHKLPADLPKRVHALESAVYTDITDRVEKLENNVIEVRKCVFGQRTEPSQMEPCISVQLSSLREMLDEGNGCLQAVGDKSRKENVLKSSPDEVPAVKESQPIGSKMSKQKKTCAGSDALENPTQVKTSDKICIAFQVFLDREGDWSDGAAMNKTKTVNYNKGHAFKKDIAQFVAPVQGRYVFGVWVKRDADTVGEETRIEIWRCRNKTYVGRIFYVLLQPKQRESSFKYVKEMAADDFAVVRVFGPKEFDFCMFEGSLLHSN